MSTAVSNIVLEFGWLGPAILHECYCNIDRVSSIELTTEDCIERISVDIPFDVNPDKLESLRFKCSTLSTTEGKDGNTDGPRTHRALSMTLERMRSLRITAYFTANEVSSRLECIPATDGNPQQVLLKFYLKEDRVRSKSISLKIPQDLVADKLYQLVVLSKNSLLSARVVPANRPSENKDNT